MFYFFAKIFFWVLAIYGLIEVIKTITFTILNKKNKFPDGTYIIIGFKNQEDRVEGFLRSYLFNIYCENKDYVDNTIIVDLNSSDKTKELVNKFLEKNDSLNVMDWEICKKYFDNIEETNKNSFTNTVNEKDTSFFVSNKS